MPASSDRPPARRPRLAAGDVIALVYLVVCAALLVWAFVVSAGDESGESMAGVIPLLATAPASLVLLMLPGGSVVIVAAVALGALANAAVIRWCGRALRRGTKQDPAP
ncbi:SCO4225 family membrane protein [Streptomyces sp. NPDC087901]|uniref:SCO4225 family membrane protein n=1 Tax=Streptomyces sp. NPDC087901 TaxID=3365818 RepID=UPI0037F94568